MISWKQFQNKNKCFNQDFSLTSKDIFPPSKITKLFFFVSSKKSRKKMNVTNVDRARDIISARHKVKKWKKSMKTKKKVEWKKYENKKVYRERLSLKNTQSPRRLLLNEIKKRKSEWKSQWVYLFGWKLTRLGGLDLSWSCLDRDSQSQHWQRAGLNSQDSLNSLKNNISTVEIFLTVWKMTSCQISIISML